MRRAGMPGPERGSIYRGSPDMWACLLHRVTGLALAGWIVLFTIQRSTLLLGAEFHDQFTDVLSTGVFRLLQLGVLAAALFHGLNGLRLIAVEFVPGAVARRAELFRVQAAVFFALFVPAAWVMLARFFDVA